MDHKELLEILRGLAAGVPSRLLKYYLSNLGALSVQGWHAHGCVLALKAGLSGEDVKEPHMEPGRKAALARDSDDVLGDLLEEGALEYGGEVLTLGDGWALVLFTGPDNAARCLASALAARDAAISWSGPVGELAFSCKAGLSEGRIYTGLVGDLEQRAVFVVGGNAVDAAMQAAEVAKPGEVLVGPGASARLAGRYQVEDDRGELKKAGRLLRFVEKQRVKSPNILLDESPELEKAIRALAAYVPGNDPAKPISSPPAPEYGPACVLIAIIKGIGFDADAAAVTSDLDIVFRTLNDLARSHLGVVQRMAPIPGGLKATLVFSTGNPGKDSRAGALTGLEILRSAASMPVTLGIKLGLAQGEVFRGTVGTPRVRGYVAHGEPVRRATELAMAARPGQYLVDGAVALDRVAGITLRPPSQGQVHGRARLVDVSTFPGETLTLLRSGSPKALIGRKEELRQCLETMESAIDGRVYTLLLKGGAGTGKTRIIEKLLTEWKVRGGRWVRIECRPETSLIPMDPWWELIKNVFSIQPGDSLPDALRKVEQGLSRMPRPLDQWTGLLAEAAGWSSSPAVGGTLSSKLKKGIIFDLFHAVVRKQASEKPFMLVFDNLHLADSSSVELFDFMADSLPDLPVLLCAAFRPPFKLRAGSDRRQRVVVEVAVQNREEGLSLLSTALGGRKPIPEVLEAIWEKGHGNPGALLELVRLLQERGGIPVSPDKKEKSSFIERLYRDVPDGLESLVVARLSGMDHKLVQILEAAAMTGIRFEFDLLRSVFKGGSLQELLAGLEELELKGWISKIIPARTLTYGFTRPVAQEAISKSILMARQRELHDRLSDALEAKQVRGGMVGPEVLAYHMTAGSAPHKALSYMLEAGARAASIGADLTALEHLQRAGVLLERQDLAKEMSMEDVLAKKVEAGLLKATVLARLGRGLEALGLLDQTVRYAEKSGDEKSALLARARYGEALLQTGRLEEALNHSNDVAARAMETRDSYALSKALKVKTEALMRLGRMEAALGTVREEVKSAAGIGKPDLLADVRYRHARILSIRGELAKSAAVYSDALASYRQAGDKFGEIETLNSLGLCHKRQGDIGRALLAFGQALRLGENMGVRPAAAVTLAHIGEIYRVCNMPAQALQNHRKALELLDWIGEQTSRCKILTCIARDLIDMGNFDAARQEIEEAAKLAESLGIRMARLEAISCRNHLLFRRYTVKADLSGLQELLEAAEELSAEDYLADAHHLVGQQLLMRGRLKAEPALLKRAVEHLRQAKRYATASADVFIQWPITYHLALAYQTLGDTERADRYFEDARSHVTTIAESIADPAMKSSFSSGDMVAAVIKS